MRRLIPIALALALAGPAVANAAPLPADTTAVISGTANLLGLLPTPVANSLAGPEAVSRDGSRVTFSSTADGLLAGDDDDVRNIYVRDSGSGAITLVSRASGAAGEPSHTNCYSPVISDDGRRVAFWCEGALDPADTNGKNDVYLRDLVTGDTVLVSRAAGLGAIGDGNSQLPSIDATGTYVAFSSYSTNFGGGSDGRERVYRRQLGGGDAVTLISRATGADGAPSSSYASIPSLSNDGNRVAFSTEAALDAAADTNGASDIYVRDVGAATTVLASRADGFGGKVGNGASTRPLISGDGKFVAFTSEATNFDIDHDITPDRDVYRRSLGSGATQLISVTLDGHKGNAPSNVSGIDDTGARVAFYTESANLVDVPRIQGSNAYVNTPEGIVLASRDGSTGNPLNNAYTSALSADGNSLAMVLVGSASPDVDPRIQSVALRRLDGATTTVSRPLGGAPFLNQGGESTDASVNGDGRYVAFTTYAPAFGAVNHDESVIAVRDTLTGAVKLVSRQDGANGALLGPKAERPQISLDGRRVAFEVTDGQTVHIYLRDIPSSRTYLVDRADGPGGAQANGRSIAASVSEDGSRVAFVSYATNLGDGDTDDQPDVHVRDLTTGRTLLANRADGAGGAKANAPVNGMQISGDGSRVAFATGATNLGDGDTDPKVDIHVRDLGTGRTLLASTARGVPKAADKDSYAPSISRDGNRVSFLSEANFGAPQAGFKLYLRDLAAGTVTVAGRADGPGGAILSDIANPVLSADGNAVAFTAAPRTSIAPGAPADGESRIYARNLDTGVTRLVSRRTGANGTPISPRDQAFMGSITADGSCVAFYAYGRILPAPASSDYAQVFLRALKSDCGSRLGGPGVLAADKVAPRLSNVKLSRKRFRVGPKATALTAKRVGRGTVLSLRVSEDARLTITVDRKRSVKKRTRYTRDGVLVRNLKSGGVRISLSGRLGRKRIAVGVHRLTLVARDAAGNKSKPVTLRITVVR